MENALQQINGVGKVCPGKIIEKWLVGGWALPLWKMMELKSVGMMTFPTEWKKHVWIALGTVFATNSSRALSQGRFEPKATHEDHGVRIQKTSNSHPSYLHVLLWQFGLPGLYKFPAGYSCWWLRPRICSCVHAIELRPVCTTRTSKSGRIDLVRASASILAVSIHHSSSPWGINSWELFWPFPVHKDCLSAASSIPSLLSWTFLGTSAFRCSNKLMQSDTQTCFIFIWHCSCQSVIVANLPVISHRTHLKRSPCSTALWSAYDSACKVALHTRFNVEEANPITWMLWSFSVKREAVDR